MRSPAVLLLCAAAGCASQRPALPLLPPTTEQVEVPAGPVSRDDHIVAFLDGQPITWRQVADHSMRTTGRHLIEQYVYWKLRQDLVRTHGITNTPEELTARARIIVEQYRKAQGDEQLRDALRRQGVTEDEYVQRFAETAQFRERLLAEKAFVYTMLTERTVETDTVAFADEEDARAFVNVVRGGTPFARATQMLLDAQPKGRVAQWPRRRLARGMFPETISKLEDRVLALETGQTLDALRASDNFVVAIYCVRVHPAMTGSYARLRDRVMEEILREPPSEEHMKMWMERLFRGSKIQYENRYSSGN